MDFGGVHPSTVAVTAGRPTGDGATLNAPIVLASNFRNGREYVRSHGTETWAMLEQAIGALEGGEAISFASGMAVASAILHVFSPKVLVLPTYSYQGVRQLVSEFVERGQMTVRFVDIADTDAVLQAADGADLVWLESATNPTLDEPDLHTILAACRIKNVPTVVDATFATPILQQPLKLGATVVMHSGTKFIGGHSDLLIGLAVAADPLLVEKLFNARVSIGATPGALEAYLALRGVRTMAIRLERAIENATVLADRLGSHPKVESVRHYGAMVSFIVHGGADVADDVISKVRIVVAATSLGGVETTMERRQKYAGDAHVPPGLIRMSVGIEHVEDLWADLAQALG
jgi:cystathionine gamma-synthase